MKLQHLYLIFGLTLMCACADETVTGTDNIQPDDSQIIHVGGVATDGLTVSAAQTRAVGDTIRAEEVKWLKGALLAGLDITYSNMTANGTHNLENEKVAILKWTGEKNPDSGRGIYTFNYKGITPEETAIWYGNGLHYFEGQYVPTEIRNGNGHTMTITNLNTDQHDDADYDYSGTTPTGTIGNYSLLSHYIGMPPSWSIPATVDQVLLPFKHRLSRVIAYVLIDPKLGATLNGYNYKKGEGDDPDTKDDPSTTAMRFNNVKVLKEVIEAGASDASHTASLTPGWTEGRKVIPHFLDEYTSSLDVDGKPVATDTDASGAFIVYTRNRDDKKFHPGEKDWKEIHEKYLADGEASGYTQQKYYHVPIYDIIVRPTYTANDSVMYDEAGYYNADKTINTVNVKKLCDEKNSIDFELTLSTGLSYEKHFEFDLNANWQTIVYLTVDCEGVDYDASESQAWVQKSKTDGYYGVNNDLGHNMSIVGSSWQRAFRNSTYNPGVTDGNDYGAIEDGKYVGQYVDNATWIAAFAQAYEGGEHHGDYFILDNDITIDSSDLPADFVFTGHLDARCHTITLTGGGSIITDAEAYDEYVTATNIAGLYVPDGTSSYVPYTIPTLYKRTAVNYSESELTEINGETYVTSTLGKDENNQYIVNETSIKATTETFKEWKYEVSQPTTLEELKTGEYYTDTEGTKYTCPANLYNKIHHDAVTHASGALFKGLNAEYDAAVGTANIHKENGKEVPVKGYRAEILNTTLLGGKFFPEGATVTGYIYNCFEGTTPISNIVPIPEYK